MCEQIEMVIKIAKMATGAASITLGFLIIFGTVAYCFVYGFFLKQNDTIDAMTSKMSLCAALMLPAFFLVILGSLFFI